MATLRTVLIVEDDADLRRLFRTALAVAGYGVHEAADATQALRQLDSEPPDLVEALDILLPGLSGLAVQQEIAAHAEMCTIPVVIVTGSGMNFDRVDVRCVLRKPVSPDEVVRTVRACLPNGFRG